MKGLIGFGLSFQGFAGPAAGEGGLVPRTGMVAVGFLVNEGLAEEGPTTWLHGRPSNFAA